MRFSIIIRTSHHGVTDFLLELNSEILTNHDDDDKQRQSQKLSVL